MNPIGTIEPSTVAANVVDAIRRDRRYVFTDDQSVGEVEDRLRAILAVENGRGLGPGECAASEQRVGCPRNAGTKSGAARE